MTPKELLTKARELITERSNWTMSVLHDAVSGSYCALGALYAADGETGQTFLKHAVYPYSYNWETTEGPEKDLLRAAHSILDDAVTVKYPERHGWHIWHVNDGMGHEATLEVFDKAIELAS